MNVASLDLCKKLFNLKPEWNDEELEWWAKRVNTRDIMPQDIDPRYDLGYLLRKLQPSSTQYNLHLYYSIVSKRWNCMHDKYTTPRFAATPEDAACKLAISLAKKGLL